MKYYTASCAREFCFLELAFSERFITLPPYFINPRVFASGLFIRYNN